jgi:hypothetical protein
LIIVSYDGHSRRAAADDDIDIFFDAPLYRRIWLYSLYAEHELPHRARHSTHDFCWQIILHAASPAATISLKPFLTSVYYRHSRATTATLH